MPLICLKMLQQYLSWSSSILNQESFCGSASTVLVLDRLNINQPYSLPDFNSLEKDEIQVFE